jgi:hypothetical protein
VRWTATFGPAGGHSEYATHRRSIADPDHDKPIAIQTRATAAASWAFDWGSAGIGAATVFGAVALGIVAATEVRRRRTASPSSAITH